MCNILTWLCQLHLIWIYQVLGVLTIAYHLSRHNWFIFFLVYHKLKKSGRNPSESMAGVWSSPHERYQNYTCQLDNHVNSQLPSLLICKLKHIKSLNIYIKILAFHLQIMQDLVFFYDRWSKDWNWLKKIKLKNT